MLNHANMEIKSDTTIHGLWTSKWAFILATTGAAVGLGNIWRFPYVVGTNGGGAFVLVYLACVLMLGIPLLIAELTLGRRGRQNPIDTMRTLALDSGKKSAWQYAGLLCVLAGFLILTFYSVIAGWALNYVYEAGAGHFKNATPVAIQTLFTSFTANPYRLLLCNTLIMLTTVAIVSLGIKKGIERGLRFLFPSMLLILLILVIYSSTTGFFGESLYYLFRPNFQELSPYTLLVALGQAFFTLSIAFGTIMMYGAYVPQGISIPKTAAIVALGDTLIALLAGLAIFPIVFAHNLAPDSGSGLIFESIPIAFGNMPLGSLFATLFFTMIVFAALTTTISLIEPTVATLMEKTKLSRIRATFIAGFVAWLIGLGPILGFSAWSGFKPFGLNILDFMDALTGNIMVPIGGLLISIFVGWKVKKEFLLEELSTKEQLLFKSWRFSLAFIGPIAISLIFLNVFGII